MPSLSSLRNVDTRKWVSGTTYGADTIVWSPVNYLMYVRTVAGSGTTDPSADSTNWALWGPTKRKQLQYVNVTLVAGSGSSVATASIPVAVVAAKCQMRSVWAIQGSNFIAPPYIPSITAPTTLQVDFGSAATGTNYQMRVEIDETW